MTIVLGFLLGIASSLPAMLLWQVFGDLLQKAIGGASFSLSGVWLSVFEPISSKSTQSIELATIRQFRDSVRFRLENYNSRRDSIMHLRGVGKYRSSQLSAVYYLVEKGKPDIGTFVLRSKSTEAFDTVLAGVYTQVFDREEIIAVEPRTEPYRLVRINLPIRVRLRHLWYRSYFMSYDDLLAWLENRGLLPEQTQKPTPGEAATDHSTWPERCVLPEDRPHTCCRRLSSIFGT